QARYDFQLRQRPGQLHARFKAGLGDLRAQRRFERTLADDFARERTAAWLEQAASFDEIGESFFLDQPADRNDRGNAAAEVGRMEPRWIDAVVDAMDFPGALRETFLEQAG